LTTNQQESNLNTMNTPNPKKIPVLNIDELEQNANWLRTLKREREQGLHPELDKQNQTPQTENWQTEENENWLRNPTPTKPNKRQRTAQNNNKTP
jgi:hypothetical protein